jgi:two-component sensor histidine kinase
MFYVRVDFADLQSWQQIVTYEVTGTDWKLSIADNGMGKPKCGSPKVGLGTSIVNALANQLDAMWPWRPGNAALSCPSFTP